MEKKLITIIMKKIEWKRNIWINSKQHLKVKNPTKMKKKTEKAQDCRNFKKYLLALVGHHRAPISGKMGRCPKTKGY